MPVEGWVYGNARKAGKKADGFFVRRCDAGLEEYRQQMLTLSKTLLEGMKRGTQQECWAAGYLDKEKNAYVIAVAANQEELLGMNLQCQENRGFFCVMAYRLSEDEIQIYQRDSRMFEPLKEMMRQINEEKKRESWKREEEINEKEKEKKEPDLAEFGGYHLLAPVRQSSLTLGDSGRSCSKNILKSTNEADETVWSMGLQRMVFTGVATEESAKKLLNQFPDGIVTVNREYVREMRYLPHYKEAEQKEESQGQENHVEENLIREKQLKERQEEEKIVEEKTVEERSVKEKWAEESSMKETCIKREQVKEHQAEENQNGFRISYLVWAGSGVLVFLLLFLMLVQNG